MSEVPGHRLVIRFATGSLVAFLAIGLALSFALARQFQSRGEAEAKAHAQFVTGSIFRYELKSEDLVAPIPVGSDRYRALLGFVRSRILGTGGSRYHVVRLKIWARDGTVLFSDEPRLIGKKLPVDRDLIEAFAGQPVAGVSDLQAAENVYERHLGDKLFETYIPLWLGSVTARPADAVVELYQDYTEIQNQIDTGFRTVILSLLVGLAALYLLLLPIAFRTSRTLSAQNARLAEQARRLEELLQHEQQTVAQLRDLNRLKSNFVAIASHELRTPLTSIIGYAKTLRQPEFVNDAESRREFLEAIERQGDRLSQLVENLLTTSRLEDQVFKLSLTRFSFGALTRDVLEGLGARAPAIRLALDPQLPELVSDRQYVSQVVQNLLSNALKFSSPGGVCELGARAEPGSLVFWVRDEGIGIPADEIDRIFDRFYQVDSSPTRRFGGVGLGLSLVQNLVEVLGGTIDVQSREGEGSTFSVRLPLVHPSVQTSDEPGSMEAPVEDGQGATPTTAPRSS